VKKITKHTAAVLTATVVFALSLGVVTFSASAFADGMPYKKKPVPVLTPLDQALSDIENKQQPVALKPEEKMIEPSPLVQAPIPTAPVAPVPDARVVEVQPNKSFFGLSVGMYDPMSHGKQAAALTLEFQPGVRILGVLQPIFGAMATTNGAIYGYGGVGVPMRLSKRILLMPSAAVGAYHEGNGYDLDRTIAYRLGTELAYEFDNKSRLGLNAHILTNGKSFGREDRTEIISLTYTTPFDLLSGKKKTALAPTPAAAAAMAPAQNTTN
jgi:lipid A 3-O-deacylase